MDRERGREEINKILTWAETKAPARFNADFVIKLKLKIDQGELLTDNQYQALLNIVTKWNINGEKESGRRTAWPYNS